MGNGKFAKNFITFDRQGETKTFVWPEDLPFDLKFVDILVNTVEFSQYVEIGSLIQLVNNLQQHAVIVAPGHEGIWANELNQLEVLLSYFRRVMELQREIEANGGPEIPPSRPPRDEDIPGIPPWMIGKNVSE